MHVCHGLANFIRGSVRCIFPLLTMLTWLALLLVPQGTDVVRSALERAQRLRSLNDLLYLWVASGLLGMSIWYSMRWLLGARLSALRFTPPTSAFWREWTPRAAGAFAPSLVAIVILIPGSFPGIVASTWGGTAAAFGLLAIVLLAFFHWRSTLATSMRGAPGRTAEGRPSVLPTGQPLPKGTVAAVGWTLALTFLLGALFVIFPLTAPRVVGAAAVAALALASINLFGSFVLTWWPMHNRLPPLGPWVLLWAILISPFTDNHDGTTLPSADGPSVKIEDEFELWAAGLPKDDKQPIYVVASEGGGMRAAYWTAAVLQALSLRTPTFASHVFALSSVSGGSVGAAMWVASIRSQLCGVAAAENPSATDMLSADLVAPAIAGLFYYDFAQRFIPFPIRRFDRSRGLEEGMQRAAWRVAGQPFEHSLDDLYKPLIGNAAVPCEHLPELLLNSTVADTGQRVIFTRLDVSAFDDVSDVRDGSLNTSRQTLAQATHHSARFPLISPPGSVRAQSSNGKFTDWVRGHWWPTVRMRLVDGGYFDNSGLQTARELIDRIRNSPSGKGRTLILAIVTSDDAVAKLCGQGTQDAPCVPQNTQGKTSALSELHWLHESLPIVQGLYQVRGSRLHIAAEEAVRTYQPHVLMLPLPRFDDCLRAPLGWALSAKVREDMDAAASAVVSGMPPTVAALVHAKASGCPR